MQTGYIHSPKRGRRNKQENGCHAVRSAFCPLKLLTGEKRVETLTDKHQTPSKCILCQVWPLEEQSRYRIQNRCRLMLWRGAGSEGEGGGGLGPEAQMGVSGCHNLFHSSFLVGTRVRAMMMGTRARQLMKRAHRGR